MEVLMLKKENEQLRRFVQRIPPEVRQALKEQQQGQREFAEWKKQREAERQEAETKK